MVLFPQVEAREKPDYPKGRAVNRNTKLRLLSSTF